MGFAALGTQYFRPVIFNEMPKSLRFQISLAQLGKPVCGLTLSVKLKDRSRVSVKKQIGVDEKILRAPVSDFVLSYTSCPVPIEVELDIDPLYLWRIGVSNILTIGSQI
uniref:Uncharacterized protein n=1 Tax=Solanum lycopersicum TaxID=4081 RepID=A0A3Q7GMV4_SOLLC